jgi:hypothetical protein
MEKLELIALRRTLYEIAGTVGAYAELSRNIELVDAYDSLSKTIDCLENYGYDMNWIDIQTNEIIEEGK